MSVKNEYIFYFIFSVFIFFQAVFLPINFLLLFVLFLSMAGVGNELLFWPFLSGLAFDLVSGRQVGLSSLALVVVAFLVFLYKRKISTFHFLFLPVFSFLSACFFDLFIFRFIRLRSVFILTILSFILSIIIRYFDIFKWSQKEGLSV